MSIRSVAIIFDDQVRPDTTGVYCRRALGQLGEVAHFLPAELASGASFLKQGYTFGMTGTPLAGAPATCNGRAAGYASPGYSAYTDPLDPVGNPLFYGTNADGTIYQYTSTFNGVMPESGPPPAGFPLKTS